MWKSIISNIYNIYIDMSICVYIYRYLLVGGFSPSEKYESRLGWLFPIFGKIKVMFQSPPTSSSWTSGLPWNGVCPALRTAARRRLQAQLCPVMPRPNGGNHDIGPWWPSLRGAVNDGQSHAVLWLKMVKPYEIPYLSGLLNPKLQITLW